VLGLIADHVADRDVHRPRIDLAPDIAWTQPNAASTASRHED